MTDPVVELLDDLRELPPAERRLTMALLLILACHGVVALGIWASAALRVITGGV